MEQGRALRVHRQEQGTEARIEAWSAPDPGPGELRIRAQWSGLNYKDALAVTGKGKILRQFPLTAGIDVSGVVEASRAEGFSEGDPVLVTGYGLSASPAGRRRAQPGATVLVGMADEKRDQALLQHALSEDMQEGPLVYLPPQGIEIREIRRRLIPLGQEGRRIRIDPQAGLQGAAQVLVDSGPEGFDALLAGTPVTTLGHPFYAGWGLTEDIAAAAQPQCMTLDELVAAALMIETIHARPDTGDRLSLADMIETMRSLF